MADLFKVAGVGGLVESLLGDLDGFTAGFALEILDSRKPEPVKSIVFVINPTRYEITEPFQAELTPTEDDTVVAEETGIILREITLEGTFGLNKRKTRKLDGGGGKEQSGTEHFFNLRNFFRDYSKRKKDPALSPYTSMVFHSLKDDDHFIVVPREFTSPRDSKQARVHRIYRIRMTAIGTVAPGKPKDKKAGGFFDAIKDISAALNDARAAFADANADLSRIRRKVQNINALMLQAAAVITAAGNFVRGIRSTFIVTPVQMVVASAAAFEEAADQMEAIGSPDPDRFPQDRDLVYALKEMQRAFDRMAQYPEAFARPASSAAAAVFGLTKGADVSAAFAGEARLTQDDFDNNLAGASVGSRTRATLGSARDAGLDLGAFNGVREWLVSRTDSIQSIANETNTAPEAIIILNDLRFPYLSEGGGPGIARPGDKILVPTIEATTDASLAGAASPSTDHYLTTEDVLYGSDLALDMDLLDRDGVMEILVDHTHGAEDAEIVRGVPNVIQGVTIILNSEVNTTTSLPDVGISRPLGLRGTLEHTLMAAVRLREGILADDRVESIESVSTVLDKDVLSQEITVRLIDGRPTPLSVPFGRASGAGSTSPR